MWVRHLWLKDYRNYHCTDTELAPEGLTVVTGGNGEGKTNLLEAIGYLATMRSFRGAPGEALVRHGADRAIVRAEIDRDGRDVLIEAELLPVGRDRVQVNRQALRRARDLVGTFGVSVFSPDDLVLVKGGPAERRRFLDDSLVSLQPGMDSLRSEVEQVLRQRGSLLKQAGGRITTSVLATLDVWDAQLARLGTRLVEQRQRLTARLAPAVASAYRGLAEGPQVPTLAYRMSWVGDLGETLLARRSEDIRRGVTTVGPQRDDLELALGPDNLPARTHASQGEQRSLCLALRLGVHALVVEETAQTPVLLLDDVFSELDTARSSALLAMLPPGQCVLTTTGDLPTGARASGAVRVHEGRLVVGHAVAGGQRYDGGSGKILPGAGEPARPLTSTDSPGGRR